MMDQMPIDPKPLCRCVLCIRDAMRNLVAAVARREGADPDRPGNRRGVRTEGQAYERARAHSGLAAGQRVRVDTLRPQAAAGGRVAQNASAGEHRS